MQKNKSTALPETRPAGHKKSAAFLLAAILAALTFACFSRCLMNDFVNYDDPEYVYQNPHIQNGLSAKSIVWAFTTAHAANWHPLTWLSHMADVSLYGMNPHGHHLSSVLLHALNSALLLLALRAMTGSLWRSAFVAAVFALHPLRVESVAWISERKDVLSALFFFLTIIAYIAYKRRPSKRRMATATLAFALGLTAKPMLVTLPFVLLLLDAWPLACARAGVRAWRKLALEKTPLFLLAAASCAITLFAQHQGEAIRTMAELSVTHRAANAALAYFSYIAMTLVPTGLATPYPHPGASVSLAAALAAGAAIVCACIAVVVLRQTRPWLLTGWFWHIGMLVPVIGLLQVGGQAMADRYTYLPQIGLIIMAAWSLPATMPPAARRATAVAAACILTGLCLLTWRQIGFWQNSIALHTRATACTARNSVALSNLGEALDTLGRTPEALACYEAAAAITPMDANLHYNWGNALMKLDRPEAALSHYRLSLENHAQRNIDALHSNIGSALEAMGDYRGAEICFRRALSFAPNNAMTHFNLGTVLGRLAKFDEAVAELREAIRLNPNDIDAHINTAIVLMQAGRAAESAQTRRIAVDLALRQGNISLAESIAKMPLPPQAGGKNNAINP